MKNAKFVLKLILALLPVLIVISYTALFPYGYMDIEYPSWKYTKDISAGKLTDITNTSPILILGDSRAMADLLPEKFDQPCVNLAVGGATSIEMYYTLKTYIENNGAPSEAIIAFAPFHYTIMDNFWTRTAYFNYLSINDMNELCSYAKASNSETIMLKGYKNDLLSYRLRFPDKYLPALVNSKFIGRYNENKKTYADITSAYGYGPFGTDNGNSDLNYETNYDRMHTSGDALLIDIYVNKLLTLCEENNINTVLTIPPMNRASYERLNPSYTEELTSYFEELEKKHPHIQIEGAIPMYENIYFGDSSHLNREGAILYTDEFISSHIH